MRNGDHIYFPFRGIKFADIYSSCNNWNMKDDVSTGHISLSIVLRNLVKYIEQRLINSYEES